MIEENDNKFKAIYKKGIKAAKLTAIAAFAFTSLSNVSREIYQEVSGNNDNVYMDYGFGSVSISNREERTPEKIYDDITKRLMEIEGLQTAMARAATKPNEQIITDSEKDRLLNEIIHTISDEANININGYSTNSLILNMNKNANGAYPGFNISGNVSIHRNKILINSDFLNQSNFNRVVGMVIHEMIHAVEFQNLLLSDQLDDFEKSLYNVKNSYIQVSSFFPDEDEVRHYYSTFIENQPHLVASKIESDLIKSTNVFDTHIKDRINQNTNGPPGRQAKSEKEINEATYLYYHRTNSKLRNILREFRDIYNIENKLEKKYNDLNELSVADVYMYGYKAQLHDYGKDFKNINLEDTYYYKMFEYSVPKAIRNMPYEDFKSSTIYLSDDESEIVDNEEKKDEDILER